MRRAVLGVALALLLLTAVPAGGATSTDQQLAKVGVLRRSDFPTGWKHSSAGSSKTVDAQAAKIGTCKTYRAFAALNKKNPRAMSPNFELDQSNVTNTVSLYPTTAKAVAAMETFRNARIPRCLEQLFTAISRAQLLQDKKTAKQLTSVTTNLAREDGIRLGDDAVVYQGTLVVGLKGGTAETIGLGFVTVRVGRALAGYSYTSDTDISAALQPAIVASVIRLKRAAPA